LDDPVRQEIDMYIRYIKLEWDNLSPETDHRTLFPYLKGMIFGLRALIEVTEEEDPLPAELTPDQINAVYWLAQGATQGETAQRVGVCRKTIQRWSQQKEFREELDALAREFAENQFRVVNGLFSKTARALSDELTDGRTRGWAAMNMLRMFGPERIFNGAAPFTPAVPPAPANVLPPPSAAPEASADSA
jgi:DNA-binding XRE family transcriptional regulator